MYHINLIISSSSYCFEMLKAAVNLKGGKV